MSELRTGSQGRQGATGRRKRVASAIARAGWTLLSVGLFASIWELAWLLGLADPRLLPPPHVFLGEIPQQARHFDTWHRWQVGVDPASGLSPAAAVAVTVAATVGRVMAGVALATVAAVAVGVAIRYWRPFGNLTLPTITLLAPVSPVAWLPVSIFALGIGNGPAIFMVFIALFFIMTLATVSQIDGVDPAWLDSARMLGATRLQCSLWVVLPAILPALFLILRVNLFAAWMVVLIAEATGVGYGLGQIIMLARNTLNPSLVFFTIALLGIIGATFDLLLRTIQRRVLYWLPPGREALSAGR